MKTPEIGLSLDGLYYRVEYPAHHDSRNADTERSGSPALPEF
jgi:hypothetical protein